MVLPPSPPDDAPRAAEERWLDALKFALRLSRSGLLLLVDHARQEALGELVEALVPEHPELDVHTDVRRMLEVPHGSTVVLVPRVEDADWLNINRPLFAQRELKVVLFCDTETTIALAQRAVDFFDWISHRVECPNRPPRFAVAGIRTVLAARAPGIIWTGGDLRAAFATARPHGKLHEVSAALPYSKMADEIREHRHAWIAWTNVDSHFRLRRVRWAHAEAGHRTRAILVEPAAPSPGWWPVHGRMMNIREARERLESAGVSFPGRVAALHDCEPEALAVIQSQGPYYTEGPVRNSASSNSKVERLSPRETNTASILRGEAAPFVPRAFTLARLRELCLQEFLALGKTITEQQQPVSTDLSIWTAWFGTFSSFIPANALPSILTEESSCAVELMLLRKFDQPEKWSALATLAEQLSDLDAAEHWSRQALAKGWIGARNMLAHVRLMKGHPEEAELLLQEELRDARLLDTEEAKRSALVLELAAVVFQQGKYNEAEQLLRHELSRFPQTYPQIDSSRRRLLHRLASALRKQEKHAEAEVAIHQALKDHPTGSVEDRIYLGEFLKELACVLMDSGRTAEAESAVKEALSIIGSTLGTSHLAYIEALYDLSEILGRQGRLGEAEELLRQAVISSQPEQQTLDIFHARLMNIFASILIDKGKYDEAEKILNQALLIRNSLPLAAPLFNELQEKLLEQLANTFILQGRYHEAENVLRRAIVLVEQSSTSRVIALSSILLSLALVLWRQSRTAEMEPVVMRVSEIIMNIPRDADANIFQKLSALATLQQELNNPQANETARAALKLLDQAPGLARSTPPRFIDRLKAIAQVSDNARQP
ncbi:tetratricopeptide repeat protein [Cystobacter ferrugineus]|uniref:Uncharacterized protein n=1 Tax=Cystobacter ferrugineus TaxID=83449 RepID=A0A1L9AVV3_9BACT|nr:tetratricopeptide repeat protein [Cystobacter ferrugineus]OJH34127.1 hypothetical protein BON30_45015 [Cystobacter ferrugineus]